jgi:hypothetical protein
MGDSKMRPGPLDPKVIPKVPRAFAEVTEGYLPNAYDQKFLFSAKFRFGQSWLPVACVNSCAVGLPDAEHPVARSARLT